MAIHDATYPTPPRTVRQLRWRLAYLFEERVGKRISEASLLEQQREDDAFARAREVMGR
jgi:hypothetical protein